MSTHLGAVELLPITAENFEQIVPAGKETDANIGDFLLRNDKIVLVLANPVAKRNANMTVRFAGGAMIDFTLRSRPNDQLSAWYPARSPLTQNGEFRIETSATAAWQSLSELKEGVSGPVLGWSAAAPATEDLPAFRVEYRLADGQSYVEVKTIYHNPGQAPLKVRCTDAVRADDTFTQTTPESADQSWIVDPWWDQAYGVFAPRFQFEPGGMAGTALLPLKMVREDTPPGRTMVLRYLPNGAEEFTLAPGASAMLVRRLTVAENSIALQANILRGLADQGVSTKLAPLYLTVRDPDYFLENAEIEVTSSTSGSVLGKARARHGRLHLELPPAEYRLKATHYAASPVEKVVNVTEQGAQESLMFAQPALVRADITNELGADIPCKVQFKGRDGTPNPYFFHETGEHQVHNLVYSASGSFVQPLLPGKYEVLISHGPEYDLVTLPMEVSAGQTKLLTATLKRVLDTRGWISTDFHSHSTPSGDNTSSQRGRVLNLLAEHVEFAPCTEHNRISTYLPHLEALDALIHMGTCSGMELTGSPLPINHQNAFPLKMYPRTQDNGAPQTDVDPEVQIARLAMWDHGSEKLVQVNHPNLVQIHGDRDENGAADQGFRKMLGIMDVVEVHPPHWILSPGPLAPNNPREPNTIFNWLQLLNLGVRKTGVVNTDAHYNFHGSGWLRNYVRCSTDSPQAIETMEIVHACERGNVVMTNGPFLSVQASSGTQVVGPGDDLKQVGKETELQISVQCANWLDIDRVLVLKNGRRSAELDFRRATQPEQFATGTYKFKAKLNLPLAKDTHLIVVAAGENSRLGTVMGPEHEQEIPIAVSNPVYVDVDGNGFQPNGDLLDAELLGADSGKK